MTSAVLTGVGSDAFVLMSGVLESKEVPMLGAVVSNGGLVGKVPVVKLH